MYRVLALLLFPSAASAQVRAVAKTGLGALTSPLLSASPITGVSPSLSSLAAPLSLSSPLSAAAAAPVPAVPAVPAAAAAPSGVVVSARPESAAWSLPDGGPLMGRAVRPEGYDFDGRSYIDLMNPAVVRLHGPEGPRDFMWVRAVRAGYGTAVGPIGEVATSEYLSDTLLFELRPGREPLFIERALESTPDRLLEDPRLSRLKMRGRGKAEERLYLGVTDHRVYGGMTEKTSRNAFVAVAIDAGGVPRLSRDGTGAPKLVALSPAPVETPGGFRVVDAKNGVLAADNEGRARMLSRHRYAADDPRLPAGFAPADYAEQSFPLSKKDLALGPDWAGLMGEAAARESARGPELTEHYPAERIWAGGAKGHGPGAPPVRVRRRGRTLFVSEGYGYPWTRAGKIPRGAAFALADGQTAFLSFDHEIRFLNVDGKRKRVYSLSVKLRDASLERVIGYYPDAVQPRRSYETGNPGIPDLWHVYPTGRVLNEDGTVDTYEGAADSNVVRRRWDLARLLAEPGWEK